MFIIPLWWNCGQIYSFNFSGTSSTYQSYSHYAVDCQIPYLPYDDNNIYWPVSPCHSLRSVLWASGNHCLSPSLWSTLSDPRSDRVHTVFAFLCLISLHTTISSSIHVIKMKWISSFQWPNSIRLLICFMVLLSVGGQGFLFLGSCEWCCSKHKYEAVFSTGRVHFPWIYN